MNKSGFTLVELLVTVAILGILAAMSVAQYQEFKQKAFNHKAVSSVHTLRMAIETYITDRVVSKVQSSLQCADAGLTGLAPDGTCSEALSPYGFSATADVLTEASINIDQFRLGGLRPQITAGGYHIKGDQFVVIGGPNNPTHNTDGGEMLVLPCAGQVCVWSDLDNILH